MWTKRNDHAPKNECALFITAQKGVFERKKTSSLTILLFSSSLPHKENFKKIIITIFLYHGPLPFLPKHLLLPLPLQNPLDYVSK
jgi:hypothetical protein